MATLNKYNKCVRNSFSSRHQSSRHFNDIITIRGSALFSVLSDNWKNDSPDFIGTTGAILTSISAGASIIVTEAHWVWKIIICIIAFITLVFAVIKVISDFKNWHKKNVTADSVFIDIMNLQEKKKK